MKKLLWVILLVAMFPCVNGAGFVLPYMRDRTLTSYQGENQVVWVVLQNGQNKTFIMDVTQTSGDEIAYLLNESQQLMPPYTYDRRIYFNVSVPRDAKVGDSWSVAFTVSSIDPEAGGMITFATQVAGAFNVLVVEDPTKRSFPWAWLIGGIVFLLIGGIIVTGLLRRKTVEQNDNEEDPLSGIL